MLHCGLCSQELAEYVRTTAERINKRYGNPAVGYTPLIHVEQAVPLHDRLAYFAVANAVVVTATRDGMNLVPYEYIVCRQGTPGLAHRTSMLVVSGAPFPIPPPVCCVLRYSCAGRAALVGSERADRMLL